MDPEMEDIDEREEECFYEDDYDGTASEDGWDECMVCREDRGSGRSS